MHKLSFAIIFLSFLSVNLYSKSFSRGKPFGHEADAYSILPFERDAKISDWFEVIHRTIDFPYNQYFEGLRNPPHQNFSWGRYGHRLFFHWGFNGKPWSPPVQEMVDPCGWDGKTVELFRQKLVSEQARRNRIVMEKTAETLHFGLSGTLRAYSNGFASLVYDAHILGDYTTTKQAPLQDLNQVIDDIKVALFDKLEGGEAAKMVNIKLDSTKKLYAVQKIRAQKVLEILQSDVPGLILNVRCGFFKAHFRKNGIRLKNL